jgi:hypothetical protein
VVTETNATFQWSNAFQPGPGTPGIPTRTCQPLAPCPTTLFTIGVLAFLVPSSPRSPLVVPVLWCFIGAQAAFLLGVTQDLALIVAGAFGWVLLARSKVSGASDHTS